MEMRWWMECMYTRMNMPSKNKPACKPGCGRGQNQAIQISCHRMLTVWLLLLQKAR